MGQNYTFQVEIEIEVQEEILRIIEREPETRRYFKAMIQELRQTGAGTPANCTDYRLKVQGTNYSYVLDTTTEKELRIKEICIHEVR